MDTQRLYSDTEIVKMAKERLKYQIEEKEREGLILKGHIEAMWSTLRQLEADETQTTTV